MQRGQTNGTIELGGIRMKKEYLKMKVRSERLQQKHRPIKGYTRDTIASNLYKCFNVKFPEGSPSENITQYAMKKVNLLPVYKF